MLQFLSITRVGDIGKRLDYFKSSTLMQESNQPWDVTLIDYIKLLHNNIVRLQKLSTDIFEKIIYRVSQENAQTL